MVSIKTWPASSVTICCLTSAVNGMVHWIFGVRLEQRIRTQELDEKLGIISVLKRSDSAGLDNLATSREWIQMFGQEE